MIYDHKTYFSYWWKRDTKNITLLNYKKPWKENGVKPRIGIRTNHPNKKCGDTCFDLFIYLGYIVFNYTNFAWNKRGQSLSLSAYNIQLSIPLEAVRDIIRVVEKGGE